MDKTTIPVKHAEIERFNFGPWEVMATKSHILKSEGDDRQRYDDTLKLPQLPEMVFPQNTLHIQHTDGFGVNFNALDALQMVDAEQDHIKVAATQVWREARQDCEHINDVVKPFDWTYTTDYSGTLIEAHSSKAFDIQSSDQNIDLEKLKSKEKIHFYADVLLFEDELADHGMSDLRVKIRVMPSSFFILLRQFIRVDGVMVRFVDTRFYHESGSSHIQREHTTRESKIGELKVAPHLLSEPNELWQHVPIVQEKLDILRFPTTSTVTSEACR